MATFAGVPVRAAELCARVLHAWHRARTASGSRPAAEVLVLRRALVPRQCGGATGGGWQADGLPRTLPAWRSCMAPQTLDDRRADLATLPCRLDAMDRRLERVARRVEPPVHPVRGETEWWW